MIRKLITILCMSAALTHAVSAHEVDVDRQFTPNKEVAGVDTPPYSIDDIFRGEARDVLLDADCNMTARTFQNMSIGAWLEQDIEERQRLVCVILMVSGGPERLKERAGQDPIDPFVLQSLTEQAAYLSEVLRAPYNLSAVEAVSAILVINGALYPGDRRAMMRLIAEK
ncbi:hypothetical protein [Parasulfitobacter algicola]|uniref:Uncharacterized protein n=1 Tax=Parasulfitobacter algicola TaxID=2614809 RepID=A0ABX2IYK1_9RHOB|nr:hypothetical protein [Sulfitobacter algicola]NSX55328.1 hypothetical protein [Sulfitobacter algicola]